MGTKQAWGGASSSGHQDFHEAWEGTRTKERERKGERAQRRRNSRQNACGSWPWGREAGLGPFSASSSKSHLAPSPAHPLLSPLSWGLLRSWQAHPLGKLLLKGRPTRTRNEHHQEGLTAPPPRQASLKEYVRKTKSHGQGPPGHKKKVA